MRWTALILLGAAFAPARAIDADGAAGGSAGGETGAFLFAKPRYLCSGMMRAPRQPLVADVDGDGVGDLVAYDPSGTGLLEVAHGVRGGKLEAPAVAVRDVGVGTASVRRGPDRRARIEITLATGGARVVARGADGAWSVAPDDLAKPGETRTVVRPPRIEADFDGDGRDDVVENGTLTLAADPGRSIPLPFLEDLPKGAVTTAGDLTGDGRADLVVVRRDGAWRVGEDVVAYVAARAGDADEDGDGLDRATEARLGSDPLDFDTDHDGLSDRAEVSGEGALDLAASGASPTHADVFVYLERVETVDGATARREIERAVGYWDSLPNANPDGTTGIRLHPVWLSPIPRAEARKPWWEQGAAHLPPLARGVAHYVVIGEGGGGQSAELGDMGGCGGAALYATFLHEFGHQVGLTHAGGPGPGLCPTYTSLMSYAFSYAFDGDAARIHYSRGELAGVSLVETSLSERLPFPIDRLRFLAAPPYRFRLEADGAATKVDWNRDGLFAKEPVRADVTDVYGADGGERFPVGKTISAPVLVDHAGEASLVATRRDGRLVVRRCLDVGSWTPEVVVDAVAPTGDPAAASSGGAIWLAVPTAEGVAILHATTGEALAAVRPDVLPDTKGASVTLASFGERVLLLLWDDANAPIRVVDVRTSRSPSPVETLGEVTSTFPPGAVEDSVANELVLGVGSTRTVGGVDRSSWRVLRLSADGVRWKVASTRTVGGDASGWCGSSRPVLLIERGPSAVSPGRVHFVARGMGPGPDAHVCFFEAITIGDPSQDEGWRLRRFYDEWTTTKSAVGACFHDGDVCLAFRWFGNVHGEEDDDLLVSHRGLGIDRRPLSDFDDVGEIAGTGLSHSIPWSRASGR